MVGRKKGPRKKSPTRAAAYARAKRTSKASRAPTQRRTTDPAPSETAIGRVQLMFEDLQRQVAGLADGLVNCRDELIRRMDTIQERNERRFDVLEAAVTSLSLEVKQNSEDIRKNSEDIRKNSEDIRKNSEDIRKNSEDIRAQAVEIAGLKESVGKIHEHLVIVDRRLDCLEAQRPTGT